MKDYLDAMHAVQTGVLMDIETGGENAAGASPKHLRVGINSAMINDDALARLLIDKGLITRVEYENYVTMAANTEVERLEDLLSERLRKNITLG
jgi:hypothetical protein